MSVKGKERSASGSDSDLDFFTVKPSRAARKASPILVPSSSDEYESTDSENPDAKKKKKRKKKRAKPPAKMSWMEELAGKRKKARGSAASRERSTSKTNSGVIEIEDSDDEVTKAARRRKRVVAELTPPPELPESEKERLRQIVNTFCPIEIPEDQEDEPSSSTRKSTSSAHATKDDDFEQDEKVVIALRMVADPARRVAGDSERAIQRYEAKKMIYVNRRDPLSRMLADVADRINRNPDDMVLEYDGAKIFRTTTPLRLGIQAGTEVEMFGYESAVYEKILKKRQADKRRRLAELNGEEYAEEEEAEANVTDGPSADGSASNQAASATKAPTPEPSAASKRIVVRIRGEWGECMIRVAENVTTEMLIHHYCKKVNHQGQHGRIRLEFDGEELDMGEMVGDMDLEDGMMIDAKIVH